MGKYNMPLISLNSIVQVRLKYKVESANINTPPKTNTYKRLPIANTLLE